MLRRKRRRIRRRGRTIAVILLLVLSAGASLTGGPVPRWILLGLLNRAHPGVRFDCRAVNLTRDGNILISDLSATLEGEQAKHLPAIARRVLSAETVELEPILSGWAPWDAQLGAVRVFHPSITLSQDEAEGTLNLAMLPRSPENGPSGARGPGLAPVRQTALATSILKLVPPNVELIDARIELGEHRLAGKDGPDDPASYRMLTSLSARGWLSPRGSQHEDYRLVVRQSGGDKIGLAGTPLSIVGEWTPKEGRATLHLSGIELSAITADKLPAVFRPVWRSLRLKGSISGATLLATEGAIEAELALANVSMEAPFVAARPGLAVSRPPVMENVSGTLRLFQVQAAASQRQGLVAEGAQLASSDREASPVIRAGVQATLSGQLEDLAATVIFTSDGLSLDAPYTAQISARGFRLERQPRLLWLTPDTVRDRLDEFCGPTALVDALLTLQRGTPTPDRPSGVHILGSLSFTEGTAAYELIPYPMLDLSGTVTFDDDQVIVRGIRGVGPAGSPILIRGSFNQTDAIDMYVTLTDLPFDEMAKDSLRKSPASPLLDVLFDERAAEKLRSEGLLAAGVEPGGPVDTILVHIRRPSFASSKFYRDMEARFASTTIVAEKFPLPLSGRDVVLSLSDGVMRIRGRDLASPVGGRVQLDAVLDLGPALFDGPGASISVDALLPTLRVTANDLPVGAALRRALDRAVSRVTPKGARVIAPGQLLESIGLDAKINCAAGLDPKDGGLDTDYWLDVEFSEATASPRLISPGQPGGESLGIRAEHLAGRMYLDTEQIEILSLGGQLYASAPIEGPPMDPGLPGPQRTAEQADGAFLLSGTVSLLGSALRGAGPPPLDLDLTVSNLNLAAPIDHLLRPFDKKLSGELGGVRQRWITHGRVDGDLSIGFIGEGPGKGGHNITAVVRNLTALRVLTEPGTFRIDQAAGALAASGTLSPEGSLSGFTAMLSDWGGEISFTESGQSVGELVGRISGTGAVRIDLEQAPPAVPAVPGVLGMSGGDDAKIVSAPPESVAAPQAKLGRVLDTLRIDLTDGRVQSPIVRSLAIALGADGVAESLTTLDVRGGFAARAIIAPTQQSDTRFVETSVTVWPSWVSLHKAGVDIVLPTVEGSVSVSAAGGRIDQLRLASGPWELTLDGGWANQSDEDGTTFWTLSTSLNGQAIDLVPSLRAILPQGTRTTLDNLRLAVPGGLTLSDGRLEVEWGRAAFPGQTGVRFLGPFEFVQMRAEPGLSISECSGKLEIAVDSPVNSERSNVQITLSDAALRVANLPITGAGAIAQTGEDTDGFIVRRVEGDCFGGRISGWANLMSAAPSVAPRPVVPAGSLTELVERASDPRFFVAGMDFAGIGLKSAIASLGSNGPTGFGTSDAAKADGRLTVSGFVGDDHSRVGTGSVRVTGGTIIDVPLVMPLVQLSNFRLPLGQKLEYFRGDLTLEGQRVYFDRLAALSSDIAIVGSGTMELPKLTLDVELATRGRALRVPVLTPLLEMVRDEVLTARVGGSLSDPKLATESLMGTRRLLGGAARTLIGGRFTAPARKLSAEDELRLIELQATRAPDQRSDLRPQAAAERLENR